MNFEQALIVLDEALPKEQLNDTQELVFQQTWEGKTYSEIAQELNYDSDYIKYVGYQLWQILSKALGERVTKGNLKSVFRKQVQTLEERISNTYPMVLSDSVANVEREKQYFRDWGEAIDVSIFYGRNQELDTLKQWLTQDQCRLVLLGGMGGIGKTALSVKVAEQVQDDFDYLIWRSLRNAPPLEGILADLIKFLSNQEEVYLPHTIDGTISRLMDYLRKHRCLIVLDNVEAVLSEFPVGCYREGYEVYGELFKRLGEEHHQSCLLLTSREKPREFASLEGEVLPVRTLSLTGLEESEGRKIFAIRNLVGKDDDQKRLIEHYRGNPLALKIVSTSIRELFDGSISDFLEEDAIVFNGILSLLDQQLNRLSSLEKKVMYWLAINRQPVVSYELQEDIVPPVSKSELLQALEFLLRRSLIERSALGFTQQPVVMEYMTEKLIEHIDQEIAQEKPSMLMDYVLAKAQTKDYVRESQVRIILEPIADRIRSTFKSPVSIEKKFKRLLNKVREEYAPSSGYAAGNIINLLSQLDVDLAGYDFSHLAVWQARLQNVNLHEVNFAHADLSKSVFAETLSNVFAAKFSPDGKYLATGDDTGVIRIWHVADGKMLLTYTAHAAWIWSIAYSPDGTILASGSTDRTVKLWSAQGESLKVLQGHEHWVYAVAFSPVRGASPEETGEILASGSSDRTIRLWSTRTGQCLKILEGHDGAVYSVAFNTAGLLATGSQDKMIKLWNITSGACVQTLEGHTDTVYSVVFSPDGQMLASVSQDKTARLWSVASGECLSIFEHPNWLSSVAFSPDGQMLATACKDHMVRLWDLATERCVKVLKGHTNWVFSVAYAPASENPKRQILVSSSPDETIRFWETDTGRSLKTLQGHTNWIFSLAIAPDGRIISGYKDYTVKLWDSVTRQCIKVLKRHNGWIWSVACSPNGRILASGSHDHDITLWEMNTGKCLKVLQGHTSAVFSVAFSPDGQTLASGSWDQTIILWDVSTGRCSKTLTGHTFWVLSVAFSLDGNVLASGSQDGVIKIWDVATGACLKTFQGHEGAIWSLAFNAERVLVSGSGAMDGDIKLWNIATGTCEKILRGHTSIVRSVAFSPDGKTLASGSQDTTIKIWDVATGDCLTTLEGHAGPVRSVAFRADGVLVSGSQDETIRLWNLATGECSGLMRAKRPYEGMNITGVTGLTEAQKETLHALGASEWSTSEKPS
jgi:WD40 repeat protein